MNFIVPLVAAGIAYHYFHTEELDEDSFYHMSQSVSRPTAIWMKVSAITEAQQTFLREHNAVILDMFPSVKAYALLWDQDVFMALCGEAVRNELNIVEICSQRGKVSRR